MNDINKIAAEAAEKIHSALLKNVTEEQVDFLIDTILAAIEKARGIITTEYAKGWDDHVAAVRAAHASEQLIDEIVGDLVRETNIFPNQVARAKELIRERLKQT